MVGKIWQDKTNRVRGSGFGVQESWIIPGNTLPADGRGGGLPPRQAPASAVNPEPMMRATAPRSPDGAASEARRGQLADHEAHPPGSLIFRGVIHPPSEGSGFGVQGSGKDKPKSKIFGSGQGFWADLAVGILYVIFSAALWPVMYLGVLLDRVGLHRTARKIHRTIIDWIDRHGGMGM